MIETLQPSTVFVPQQESFADTRAYAASADVTWQFADKLYLTGGLRYSRETKSLLVINLNATVAGDTSANSHSVTPRLVLRYNL